MNKTKAKICCVIVFSIFISNVFCQNVETSNDESINENTKLINEESPFATSQIDVIPTFGKAFEVAPTFKAFLSQMDFILDFAPTLYLNTASTLISAPSPIFFPFTMGFIWPKDTLISIMPKVSFFSMYYLWYFNSAYPAEIENRTVTSLSFMLNIPITFSVYLRRSYFQFSLGVGFLLRFGFLSYAVTALDSGYFGSAEVDAGFIKDWFWQNGRFVYISTEFTWLFRFTNLIKAGPTINVYFPVGAVLNDGNLNGLIASVGMKFVL